MAWKQLGGGNNEDTAKQLSVVSVPTLLSQSERQQVYDNNFNKIASSESETLDVLTSPTTKSEVVQSSNAMNKIANSNEAMDTIKSNNTAINTVSSSDTARNVIGSSDSDSLGYTKSLH